MSALDLLRQSSLVPTDKIAETTITIVGVGAVGSHVAECLGKIGIRRIVAIDFDVIESHNLPNQGFRLGDLGKLKVEALKSRLEQDLGMEVMALPERVDETYQVATPIVIAALDSMSARKLVWNAAKASLETQLYIDPRMGAQYGIIYAVPMADQNAVQAYEKTLFSDAEGYVAPCTEKATIYCAWVMSGYITSLVADYVAGRHLYKEIELDLALKTVSGKK